MPNSCTKPVLREVFWVLFLGYLKKKITPTNTHTHTQTEEKKNSKKHKNPLVHFGLLNWVVPLRLRCAAFVSEIRLWCFSLGFSCGRAAQSVLWSHPFVCTPAKTGPTALFSTWPFFFKSQNLKPEIFCICFMRKCSYLETCFRLSIGRFKENTVCSF